MIEFAHTIAYPRTMMIHSLNALFTDTTMMYSRFFDKITFEAIADLI